MDFEDAESLTLSRSQSHTAANSIFAVGFEINTYLLKELISSFMERQGIRYFNQKILRSYSIKNGNNGPSVMVVSYAESLVLEKFKVCCLVWNLQLVVRKNFFKGEKFLRGKFLLEIF